LSNITKAEGKYYASLKQKKYRDLEKKFIIEGPHLIEEVLKSEYYSKNLDKVFLRDDYSNDAILKKLSKANIPVFSLESNTFDKITDTVTPQGIFGIVKYRTAAHEESLGDLIIAFDEINDPGNLGTILRTAYWFGVKGVALSRNSVDIYNPKVIRGSQGGSFNVQAETNVELHSYLSSKKADGWNVLLTDLSADIIISDMTFTTNEKYVIVFGNEANGISKEILEDESFHRVKIRSYSDCESLNVGISVGIVLSEVNLKLNK
jgi:TrmH family RNA methyltransferase